MPEHPPSTAVRRAVRPRRHTVGCAEASSAPRPRFDRRYWIEHCEGYRVDSAEGRLGFVDEIRRQANDDGATVLAVRAGLLGRRLLLVPAAEVAYVVPRAERIWLRSPVSLLATEPSA